MTKLKTTEEALASLENQLLDLGLDKEGTAVEKNQKEKIVTQKEEKNENNNELSENDDIANELTDFEKEQQELGWNPNGKKSAEQWAKDGQLIDAIKDRNKEINKLQRTIDELKDLQKRQGELIYQQVKSQLDKDRQTAQVKGDQEAIKVLDEREKLIKTTVSPPQVPPEVSEFQERNADWWNGTGWKEQEMRNFAIQRDSLLMELKLPIKEHMQRVEDDVKDKFFSYFDKNQEEDKLSNTKTPAVEGNKGVGIVKNSKKRYTINDLNLEQQSVVRDFIRIDLYKFGRTPEGKTKTINKYIDDLVALGELKNDR